MTCAHLISPLIDDGHVDVVNEHCHLLASRWAIGCTHPLVHIALNGSLSHKPHHIMLLENNNNKSNLYSAIRH